MTDGETYGEDLAYIHDVGFAGVARDAAELPPGVVVFWARNGAHD
jgi:hypothetical protein